MVWVTQGEISDRTVEHLVTSDKGVMMFRKVLLEQIERVERGEDPLGVIRDRARNEPMIEIQRERKAHYAGGFLAATGNDRTELRYVRKERMAIPSPELGVPR